MKRIILTSLGLLSVLACCPGCEVAKDESKPKKLIVGRVDSAVILQSDPEYMTLAQQYLREQADLRTVLMKRVKEAGDNREALEKLKVEGMAQQKEVNKKWMGKTNEYLTTRHSRMQTIVGQICTDKGIDIVLIDSKQYPTVEYGAVDITQDVLLKTSGGSAPINPTPTAGQQ